VKRGAEKRDPGGGWARTEEYNNKNQRGLQDGSGEKDIEKITSGDTPDDTHAEGSRRGSVGL